MKKLWVLLAMMFSACTNAPKFGSFFHNDDSFGIKSLTQTAPAMTTFLCCYRSAENINKWG
jgi:hypothetical protein